MPAAWNSSAVMRSGVARSAKGNEVLLGIIAGLTAKLFVVNFQVRHSPTRLTPPAIATQHLSPQTLVFHRIRP